MSEERRATSNFFMRARASEPAACKRSAVRIGSALSGRGSVKQLLVARRSSLVARWLVARRSSLVAPLLIAMLLVLAGCAAEAEPISQPELMPNARPFKYP